MISFNNLSKSFSKRKILDNINGKINSTGLFLITGKSGSGKSTIASLLLGLIRPDSGSIIIDNREYKPNEARGNKEIRERYFSYSGDKPTLIRGISLADNLSYYEYDRDEYLTLKDRLGFKESNKPLYLLSGGNIKKAELIVAILIKKPILLLDEPYAFLDTKSKESLTELLNAERKKRLVVLISHELDERLKINYRLDMGCSNIINTNDNDGSNSYINNINNIKRPKKLLKRLRASMLKSSLSLMLISFLIGLLFSFTLLLGVVTRPSEARNPISYALSKDPYDSFIVGISDDISYSSYNSLLKEDGIELYKHPFFTLMVVDDNTILEDVVYSDKPLLDKLVLTIGNKNVELKNKVFSREELSFSSRDINSLNIISRALFNKIIENGLFTSLNIKTPFSDKCISIDGNKLYYNPNSQVNRGIKIVNEPGYLAIPGLKAGSEVIISNNNYEERLITTADGGNKIELNLSLYNYLSFKNESFGYLVDKAEAMKLVAYSSSYIPYNILEAGFSYTKELSQIFMISAALLLILDIAFIAGSSYIKRDKLREERELLILNGDSQGSYSCFRILWLGLSALIPALISFIYYASFSIPYINKYFYLKLYDGDYSERLQDMSYDGISMLSFQALSSLSLLILIPVGAIAIIELIRYAAAKRKSY